MKKIIIALLLLATIASSARAINVFEKVLYKRDVIKAYNTKVLVNPLTGEIRYIWYETIPAGTNGYWEPVSGTVKDQFQVMYDQQNAKKIKNSNEE